MPCPLCCTKGAGKAQNQPTESRAESTLRPRSTGSGGHSSPPAALFCPLVLSPGAHLSCCHDGSAAQKPVRQIGDINSSMQSTPGKVSPCAPWFPDSISRMSPDLAANDRGHVLPWNQEGSLVAGRAARAPALSTGVTVVTLLCTSLCVMSSPWDYCED